MDNMAILGLVWKINSYTPCLIDATAIRLTRIVAYIISESEKHFTRSQVEKIILAMLLSAEWHKGFYRHDKVTPYIVHPLEVAETLFQLGVYDFKTIIAAIFHDGIEDEEGKDKRRRKRVKLSHHFGPTVRDVVELVTKSRIPWKRAQFFVILRAEKRQHIAWRAQVLKLVDSETNGRTYDVFDDNPPKQKAKVAENDLVYPPVAETLSRTLKKLVRAGKLKTEPYEYLAEKLLARLMKTIEPYR